MLHNHLIAIALLFAVSGCAGAESDKSRVEKVSDSVLHITRGDVKKKIALEIKIADWLVSCDRRHAIVWGQTTEKLPVGVTPYARVYVVDMVTAVTRDSLTTTRGPFEVEIDLSGAMGLVDDYVIELATGNVKSTDLSRESPVQTESCPDFKGRRLSSNCLACE